MIFEIYQDNAGEYRVRLKGDNGEPLPDGYTQKHNAQDLVGLIKKQARTARVYQINKDGSKSEITPLFQ